MFLLQQEIDSSILDFSSLVLCPPPEHTRVIITKGIKKNQEQKNVINFISKHRQNQEQLMINVESVLSLDLNKRDY